MPTATSKPTTNRNPKKRKSKNSTVVNDSKPELDVKEISAMFRDRGIAWGEVVSEQWPSAQIVLSNTKPTHQPLFSGAGVRAIVWGLPQPVAETIGPNAKLVYKSAQQKKLGKTVEALSKSADRLGLDLSSTTVQEQIEVALLAIATSHGLRSIVSHCDDLQWRRLVQSVESVVDFGQHRFGQNNPLLEQLLNVELPLTLSWLFADVDLFQSLSNRALQQMQQTKEMLDSDGMPKSEFLQEFTPFVASWSRCCELIERQKLKIDLDLKLQLESVPEQFFRLQGAGKRLLLSSLDSVEISPEFARQVLAMSNEKDEIALAHACGLIANPKKEKKEKSARLRRVLPVDGMELNCISEWGESAIIRSGWGKKSNKLAIGYGGHHSQIEFGSACTLVSGLVETKVMIDDEEASFCDDWELVCEFHDHEASFLEFEIDLNDGAAVVHRQILMSHDSSFIFLHDVVSTKQPHAKIEYCSTLPLAENIEVMPETETRELYLLSDGRKIESLVLPLALPEWKVGRCDHSLTYTEDAITLQQTDIVGADGGGLSAPLLFDLNAKRSRKKRTWRQLTVGESLGIVPSCDAVAYRVQLDKKNFVFYRAIRELANRTFFGENFNGDFFAGRLEKCGTVTAMVQVDE